MHIWRIREGIPSWADAALVVGGPVAIVGAMVASIEPVLDWFEPRGWAYAGFAVVLGVYSGAVGLAGWLFLRNQRKIRPEIVLPRITAACCAMPLVAIFHAVVMSLILSAGAVRGLSLDAIQVGVAGGLVLAGMLCYARLVSTALRFPERTALRVMRLSAGLSLVGVLAKVAAALLKQ
jgi:hypothetical protein